jgi:threonine dehydrogenase-like Zn-dependent dehydrogenase
LQAGDALKQAGGADVILVTSNSYKTASESLQGLRPDGRMVLMGLSNEPLIVTSEIIGNRSRCLDYPMHHECLSSPFEPYFATAESLQSQI